jgi:hypothetical protein
MSGSRADSDVSRITTELRVFVWKPGLLTEQGIRRIRLTVFGKDV